MIKLLFDLDGTVIDSSKGIKLAFDNACLNVYNEACDFDCGIIGPSIDVLHDYYFSNKNVLKKELFIKEFRKLYDSQFCLIADLYENAYSVLNELSLKNEITMHIFTNKPIVPTIKILKELNIHHFFETITSVDSGNIILSKSERVRLFLNKNRLDNTFFLIGDTIEDSKVAFENKIDFIFAQYGYGQITQKENIKYKLAKFENLLNFLA